MSGRADKCERCLVSSCKGVFAEPKKNYGRYAYWCGEDRDGWKPTPCEHLIRDEKK